MSELDHWQGDRCVGDEIKALTEQLAAMTKRCNELEHMMGKIALILRNDMLGIDQNP